MSVISIFTNITVDQINNAIFIKANPSAASAWSASSQVINQITIPFFSVIGAVIGAATYQNSSFEDIAAATLVGGSTGYVLGNIIGNELAIRRVTSMNMENPISPSQCRALSFIKVAEVFAASIAAIGTLAYITH